VATFTTVRNLIKLKTDATCHIIFTISLRYLSCARTTAGPNLVFHGELAELQRSVSLSPRDHGFASSSFIRGLSTASYSHSGLVDTVQFADPVLCIRLRRPHCLLLFSRLLSTDSYCTQHLHFR
jgi:hypothetical protein